MPLCCVTLDELLKFKFSFLTHQMRIIVFNLHRGVVKIKQVIYMKHLEWCLAYSKHSKYYTVLYYLFSYMSINYGLNSHMYAGLGTKIFRYRRLGLSESEVLFKFRTDFQINFWNVICPLVCCQLLPYREIY